jgi:hypothetical protein
MVAIKKLEGTTPSERYLKSLCEKSFLSLWSYPNVYRDQGQQKGKGDGKEVCDLLVVFDNNVIIFSDKSCTFYDTGDLKIDWQRWYRRSIEQSADQVYGAERWIREHPDRLFLDRHCTQRFPLDLAQSSHLVFHRIVVALGAGERCRRHFNGGSGSLILCPEVSPPTNPSIGSLPSRPFVVGRMPQDKGFVHVLDDVTLDVLLRELDTISDFIYYLAEKEKFLLMSGRQIFASGEENLLAYYLRSWDERGRHHFVLPDAKFRAIILDENLWTGLSSEPQHIKYKTANQVSYGWDRMLEVFNKDILAGKMVRRDNEDGVAGHERRVRALARPNRFERRMLALAIADLRQMPRADDETRFRSVILDTRPDTGYIFLVVPRRSDEGYETVYRIGRGNMLKCYCMVFRYKNPQLRHVVGIATNPRDPQGASEEIVYVDGSDWTPDDDEAAQEIQRKFGILTHPTITHYLHRRESEPNTNDSSSTGDDHKC